MKPAGSACRRLLWLGRRSRAFRGNVRHLGLAVTLRLGMAVLTLGQGERFLVRQRQSVPTHDREVEDADYEVDQRAEHAWQIGLVGVVGDQGDDSLQPGCPSATVSCW